MNEPVNESAKEPVREAVLTVDEPPRPPSPRKTVEIEKTKKPFFGFLKSVPLQEKINFARHLSVTIESGLPLVEALELIKKQASSKRFRKVLEQVVSNVNSGQSLSQSLSHFNYIFDDFFVNLVAVGEASGNLSETLQYLSGEIKKQREISNSIRSALIYPGVILAATVGVTVFLITFIFPKILPIFASLNIELPFSTKAIMWLLKFISSYGFFVAGGIIALAAAWKLLLSIEKVDFWFDRFVLYVPFVSGVLKNITIGGFTRSLSILLKSGMNIVDALTVAKGTFHNRYYQKEFDRVIDSVRRGESMARYMDTKPKFFPPMLVGMIQIGEDTGKLEQNLLYLSDYYESEVDETLKNLTSILEPMLLLFMGLAVGFVALAIITPIYSITQGIKP